MMTKAKRQAPPTEEQSVRQAVPPELAEALDESADDLRHDRIEDVGEFLDRARARIMKAAARGARPKSARK